MFCIWQTAARYGRWNSASARLVQYEFVHVHFWPTFPRRFCTTTCQEDQREAGWPAWDAVTQPSAALCFDFPLLQLIAMSWAWIIFPICQTAWSSLNPCMMMQPHWHTFPLYPMIDCWGSPRCKESPAILLVQVHIHPRRGIRLRKLVWIWYMPVLPILPPQARSTHPHWHLVAASTLHSTLLLPSLAIALDRPVPASLLAATDASRKAFLLAHVVLCGCQVL